RKLLPPLLLLTEQLAAPAAGHLGECRPLAIAAAREPASGQPERRVHLKQAAADAHRDRQLRRVNDIGQAGVEPDAGDGIALHLQAWLRGLAPHHGVELQAQRPRVVGQALQVQHVVASVVDGTLDGEMAGTHDNRLLAAVALLVRCADLLAHATAHASVFVDHEAHRVFHGDRRQRATGAGVDADAVVLGAAGRFVVVLGTEVWVLDRPRDRYAGDRTNVGALLAADADRLVLIVVPDQQRQAAAAWGQPAHLRWVLDGHRLADCGGRDGGHALEDAEHSLLFPSV